MGRKDGLFLINDDSIEQVERLAKSHHEFKEEWIRDLLHRHPSMLPVDSVLADAGDFCPIAIEVSLDHAGIADIVGVTTGGYPVVVETKLWRNPQSRREVLAQTLDYITEMSRRDYAWLQRLWTENRGAADGRTLFEALSEAGVDDLDENEFAERVDGACERGDILGVIVGDRIQRRLANLVDELSAKSSHLGYVLALLELRCFRSSSGQLAVVPTVVQEVVPVERSYIRIEASEALAGQLNITPIQRPADDGRPARKRTVLTEEEFVAGLKEAIGSDGARHVQEFVKDLERTAGIELHYKQRALVLKVPDPDDIGNPGSVFAITNTGLAYNMGAGGALKWEVPAGRIESIMRKYHEELAGICPGFKIGGISHLDTGNFVPVKEFLGSLDPIAEAIRRVTEQLRAAGE